jgi:carboxymethylenebutenolidase
MAKAPTEEPPVCYQPTARPPLPPIAGGSGLAGSEQIVLEAEDGNHFSAFTASTDEPGAPGMVILPDVRGLHAFYRDVAATVAHLRSDAGGGARAVYTVGFCFGGRHSFNQAARGHGLAGVIGFYGGCRSGAIPTTTRRRSTTSATTGARCSACSAARTG